MTQDEIIQGRERLARWMGWWIADQDGYELSSTIRSTLFPKYASELNEGRYPDIKYRGKWCDWRPDQNDSQMRMIREKMNEEERNLFMNELVRLLESIEWFEMVNAPPSMQFEAAIKAIGE